VRRAAARLGIRNDETTPNDQDVSFEAHLDWSEVIFNWVARSSVAEEYCSQCFEMPFSALDELDAYNEL